MARGHPRDFERYVANVGIPSDPVKNELFPTLNYNCGDDFDEQDRPRREYVKKSLLCTVLGCYIYNNSIDEKRVLLLLNVFARKLRYSQRDVLNGMEVTIDYRVSSYALKYLRAAFVIDILTQDLKFDQQSCQNVSRQLGRKIVDHDWQSTHKDPERQRLVDSARADLLECKCSLVGKLPACFIFLNHFESCALKLSTSLRRCGS